MLLVSHEASLTGAPRVAVDILRATQGVVGERVVVIRWPGPLAGEMSATADRARLEPLRRARVALRRFRRSRAAAVRIEQAAAEMVLRREKPDLVYLNTVKSACYVRPALDLGLEVILHVHELDDLASDTLNRYALQDAYRRIRLVACSTAAGASLREITGVEDIEIIPSAVDEERIRELASDDAQWAPQMGSGAPGNGVVAACGLANAGKGTDLWLQVAGRVRSALGPDCPLFVWIGTDAGGTYQSLAATMGVDDVVYFAGPRSNPYPAMRSAEILTVPSRLDAYPLVVLEGMALAKPIVAFAVGGIGEQLGDAGVLVPAGDVSAMAEAIVRLMRDEQGRARLSELAIGRLKELHSIQRFGQAVRSVVAESLANGSRNAKR